MNFRVVLDENVSLRVFDSLKSLGYEVLVIAKLPKRGMSDAEVFAIAQEKPSLLITRDAHFTNSLRFPPARINGILYITHGNLLAAEEADLVEKFLSTHPPKIFSGHLVFLSPASVRIR